MQRIEFASDFTSANVDKINGVIRGVSVITSGVTARGHDLEVDDTTLKQMQMCAKTKNTVPVKVDHKSGAGAVCGYLTNFCVKGAKLTADWHLLNSHPQREQILEAAERMPGGVGLSAAFVAPEGEFFTASGKKAARCEELISVDYVALPAANPTGLFASRVDTTQFSMDTANTNPTGAASSPDVAALLTQVLSRLDAIEARSQEQDAERELAENPLTLEEAAAMSDDELAQLGLTRQDVDQAVEEALAADEGQAEGQAEGAEGQAEDGEAVAAGAAAPAAAGASTGFSALQKQIVELSAEITRLKGQKSADRDEILFQEISDKVDFLASENAALRNALMTGGPDSSPGVDRNGLKFFSAGKQEGAYENLVAATLDANPGMTRAKAFAAVRKAEPEAYKEFLSRQNVIGLGE